jgi:cytochrome c-type biogenesis protein CcmH
MKTKTGLLSFILTLLAAVVLAGSVWAQQRPPSEISDDEVNAIARKIYCPVCEGIPLDTCPTLACIDWREEIRLQLAQGRTPAEIEAHFARQYGNAVLAEPPREGISLLIWLAPVAAVLLGGVLFGNYMRNLRRAENSPMTITSIKPTSPIGKKSKKKQAETAVNLDEYIQRIEQEVDRDK